MVTNMEIKKNIDRKRRKFAARLKATKNINCTDEPTPNIVLCNVGQATGLTKETILKALRNIGEIKLVKFIAEKGESHSFVVFNSTQDAELYYRACNGRPVADDSLTPVYINYVENVPNTEVICQYKNPEGLKILDNFITEEEENKFMQLFDWIDESNLKNRQVRHFGYEFRYGSNDVDLTSPLDEKIPEQCDVLWQRLRDHGIDIVTPDQLTVNKYSPGQGIPSHVDRHSPFGDTILSLSLGSSVVMDWKHHSGIHVPVEVPARSLLIMQGEARYDWQHGIVPRTWDPIIEARLHPEPVRVIQHETVPRGTRISLTFRKTRVGPCPCGYKVLCDSVEKKGIEDDVASHLEELHVHQVYEQIAGHFSTTRHKPWPKVVEFLRDTSPGSVLLDLGAGNGKNLLQRGDILQIAGERCNGLLAECKNYTRSIPAADCIRLDVLHSALRDHCADVVICIAVIHHFSSLARRKEAVSTIARLLRPGGRALITVWAKDQTKSNYLCKGKEGNPTVYSTVGGLNLPVHENRTQFQHNDLLVPWKLRTKQESKLTNQSVNTLLRYYHVFEEGELESLCDLPNLKVETSFYEEGNWCVTCIKI